MRTNYRVRASELEGRGWLNTGGKKLQLADLRGKIVLLDFWTFCCINCLHVIDELRPLEEKYADELVIVGVHSPKFEHEADPEALASAVERYEIHHPVLDDPELTTWQAYTARAWPTLVVVDPDGYIVAHLAGEGHAGGLESLVDELVAEHEAKGTLHRGDGPYVPAETPSRDLRFPGKVLALPSGNFLVGDTGHHRLVEFEPDLTTVVRTIGTGDRGSADGGPDQAQFNEPQGLALLPESVRNRCGYDVVIADSVNHLLRGVRLDSGEVTTVVGSGVQRLLDAEASRRTAKESDAADQAEAAVSHKLAEPAVAGSMDGAFAGAGLDGSSGESAVPAAAVAVETTSTPLEYRAPHTVALSSPWDVLWSEQAEALIIAMAGVHQLFSFDPVSNRVGIFAGTGDEGLLDGAAPDAWFAQPSGLAQDANGNIWVADSESSAVRVVSFLDLKGGAGTGVQVHTAVGTGLFDFGFRDGEVEDARMQHPLGVADLPDGSVAIADTYNGAVRRFDPATRQMTTLAQGLAEPSDVLLDTAAADGGAGEPVLIVVESNKHQLVRIPIPKSAQRVDEGASQTQRPRTDVAPGGFELAVRFSAPTGQKLDDRWGDPTQLKISATPPELLTGGGGTSVGLNRVLTLSPDVPEGVLHITARAAACDGEEGGEIPDHAACHMYQQDWGIPVSVSAGGDTELSLDLRGLD
ncbi:NHL domain-containing thioredoxin family protein [Arthrobacter sp. H14]|uniref:NHL domain-containing thioredoxin family protein n=1 Tax=Arthrobacter sp. H14 TaxID=1312959 RepID=UPI00047E91F5|nr:NHL domain-containing thioredoxin family protein [Arthrobacter sp. H14]